MTTQYTPADQLPEWSADPNGFGGEQWGTGDGFVDHGGPTMRRFGYGSGVAYGFATAGAEGVSAMLSEGLASGFGSDEYYFET